MQAFPKEEILELQIEIPTLLIFLPTLTCLKSNHSFKMLGYQARRANWEKQCGLQKKDFKAERRISQAQSAP